MPVLDIDLSSGYLTLFGSLHLQSEICNDKVAVLLLEYKLGTGKTQDKHVCSFSSVRLLSAERIYSTLQPLLKKKLPWYNGAIF